MAKTKVAAKKTKVAILGFGTVGGGVADVLADRKFAGMEVTHVYNRDYRRKLDRPQAKKLPKLMVK